MTSEPVTASTRAGRRLGLLAIAITVAGLGTITHPFDRTATVLVAGCTIVALVRAFGTPSRRMHADARTNRGLGLWTVLTVILLTWEMFAWAHQSHWSIPDPAHPTISTLLGPYLDHGPLRFAGWFAWLAFGWILMRPRMDEAAVAQQDSMSEPDQRVPRHTDE